MPKRKGNFPVSFLPRSLGDKVEKAVGVKVTLKPGIVRGESGHYDYENKEIVIRQCHVTGTLKHEVGHAIALTSPHFKEANIKPSCWESEMYAEVISNILSGETLDDAIRIAKAFKYEWRRFYQHKDTVRWKMLRRLVFDWMLTHEFVVVNDIFKKHRILN